ncbi:programmed cell death 1 ligand 1-like isoform X2 [Astatotilapia calliptera]|uniref:programmed cell death 1 ligand 1-like isoform X2 n=1 Tax=Astatotilapia calliptera TaxID=8154 RepID=UPI000E416D0E|nr:programmed cell death 1 ligand 1-like isoform X2 [Astatotilapia calliptera]
MVSNPGYHLFVRQLPGMIAELTVKQAKDVTLECYGPSDANIMISWQKPDLQSEYYVFYFSDEHIHKDKQHESFKGRVELKDPEIKNGNFSMILKNVTMNDAGIYECYAGYNRQRPQLLKSINLKVKEEGQTVLDKDKDQRSGADGVEVDMSISVVLAAAVLLF